MTRKTLVSILTLTLCAIVLMNSETAETREPSAYNASDYIQHGRAKFAAGDYAGAIADFDKAFQVAPDRPEVSYYRANAKFQLGKWEHEEGNVEQAKRTYHSAIEDYARVITLDPENPPAYIFGGMVHLRLADLEREAGNSQQARHHAHAVHKMGSQLTDVDPENVSGWRTRGVANYNLGVNQILEQDVTVEIERDGNRVRGQDTPAEADFQKAKALNPDVEKLYLFSNGGEE